MRALLVALLPLAACSEYGFQDPSKHAQDDTAAGPDTEGGSDTPSGGGNDPGDDTSPGGDTGPTGDTGGDTGGDTAPGSGEDGCYEPEDGYSANPEARIVVTDASTAITVTLVLSDTAYSDDLVLDAPAAVFLAHGRTDAPGTQVTIGPYAAESELVFGLNVLDTGDHWQSGPASRNSDGVAHVAVTYEGGCSWLIGFEDLAGGGDLDFNDVVLRVAGGLRQDG